MIQSGNNWVQLGTAYLSAAANGISLSGFAYCQQLMMVWSGSFATADTACLLFNSDFSPVYSCRSLSVPLGATTFSQTNNQSANALILVRDAIGVSGKQLGVVYINNQTNGLTNERTMRFTTAVSTNGSNTISYVGNGSYSGSFGTLGNIKQITLRGLSGNNMTAGSGFALFGSVTV